ncbi:MAG: hypothetical protein KF746_11685 [Chitinophagaceae bacterium]|nr:hypothetical protein [Chitinophagaceae bacterium]
MLKSHVNILLLLAVFYSGALYSQNVIRLHPDNRHYLLYQNKPIILITAAEHYGALVNTEFDYVAYLNALQKRGMNYTRIFSGAYIEGEKDIQWMRYNNTLAPKPSKLIAPWKRSNVPGYANGDNKFDLDQWNEDYFERIKDILKQAAERSIIVEFTLFGNQYSDSVYAWSPLYPDNNIRQVGIKRKNGFLDFQSLKDPVLVARQEAMVVKIVKELNDFDNLYYEISNEPYNEVKDPLPVDQWHVHIANLIRETEKELPKQHLIASNQAIFSNPLVDIANYHYVHIPDLPRFDSLLLLNKVIGMDETMGTLKDVDANDARVEAWDFILHGGGIYNNLSWEYTPEKPAGLAGTDTVHQYFSYLQKFISGFDYTKMNYSPELLIKTPGKAITRLLAEPGRQYALYIHHSTPDIAEPPRGTAVWKYEADTTMFSDTITLHFKAGRYEARWYDPSTGDWIGKPVRWKQKDGNHTFFTPSFTTDIALRITGK